MPVNPFFELNDQDDTGKEVNSTGDELQAMLTPGKIGYIPTPTNTQPELEGSVFLANFKDSTTWGALVDKINSPSIRDLDTSNRMPVEETLSLIPDDLVENFADKFFGKDPRDYPLLAGVIRREQNNKALIAQNPYRSFAYSLPIQAIDPMNWLTAAPFMSAFSKGSSLLKTMAGTGLATTVSTIGQEAVISSAQQSREAQESFFNVAASGMVGAALGGLGHGVVGLKRKGKLAEITARRRMKAEVLDVLTEKDKVLDENGLLTKDDLTKMSKPLQKTMVLTNLNRLVNSPFPTAKQFASNFIEHNYTLNKHLTGETSRSVERDIKLDKGIYANVGLKYQDAYFRMVGIENGVFKKIRAKIAPHELDMGGFNDAASLVLTTGRENKYSHVNEGAEILRKGILDPIKNDLIELGLIDKDEVPENSFGYFMQVYNKNKIVEQGGKSQRGSKFFPYALHQYYKAVRDAIEDHKNTPEFKSIDKEINANKELLKDFSGEHSKATNKQVLALKEKIKILQKSLIKSVPKKWLNSKGELRAHQDDAMLWTNVDQTIDKILGDEGGTLLHPSLDKALGTSALKERMVLADQESMREWHVTDASKLIDEHIKAMTPLIQMTKAANRHGAKTIPELRQVLGEAIAKDFDAHSKGKTGKEAQDIRRRRDNDTRDMSNTIDTLMGVYGGGVSNMSASAAKFYNNVMAWNASRFLGYMTISSFPDNGAQVFANGPYRFIHDGLAGTLSIARKMARKDAQGIGYALETLLGTRIKSFTEHNGLSTESGVFTKAFTALTSSIGNLSGMNTWNNWQHEMAAHIGINRTLQTIREFVTTGKAEQKDLTRIAKLGIDREHFKTIYNFTKDNVHKDAMFANWADWDIKTKPQAEAMNQFQLAVGKEIDSIVLTPGVGDKIQYGLLDANTPVGKLLFHFKTFLMSATNKLLYSGAQRTDDMNMYAGIISMLSMGALSYVTSSLLKGKAPDLSFENLSHEAVDRSGVLGIWGEIYNIGSKLLGFGGVSRYQSRDLWGALLGPSGGALSEVLSIMNKTRAAVAGESPLTEKDGVKIARLFPLQNLFYLDYLNKIFFRGAARLEGAEHVPPPQPIMER